jgi:anti-sigma B factor antagonist
VPRSHHHLQIAQTEEASGRQVLHLTGDVDLQTSPTLRESALAAGEQGADVVIDLREVRFMDSPGLGTLIFCHQRLAEQGSTLVVRSPRGDVRQLFEVVRLNTIITIEPVRPSGST